MIRKYARISRVLILMAAVMMAALPGPGLKAVESPPAEDTGQQQETEERVDHIEEAKNCIVEIRSGFMTEKNNYYPLKNGSGVVISSGKNSGSVYILTTYNTVRCRRKIRKKFCKEHKLDEKNANLTEEIRVITVADGQEEAEIVTFSKEYNYCLLECQKGLKDKDAILLGSSDDLVTGDPVWSLGFLEDKPEGVKGENFEKEQVSVRSGQLQDKNAGKEKRDYLQHQAEFSPGMTGGPLLNKKGELVGINDAKKTEQASKIYYAVPVEIICKDLNSHTIPYSTNEMLRQRKEFEEALSRAEKLLEDKSYKDQSKEALQKAVEEGRNLKQSQDVSTEEYEKVKQALEKAEQELVPKMKTSRKVVIVLGCITAFLLLWFLKNLIWWLRHKRRLKALANRKREPASYSEKADSAASAKRNRKKKTSPRDHENDFDNRKDVIPVDRRARYHEDMAGRRSRPDKRAGLFYNRTGQFRNIEWTEFRIGKKKENDYVIDNKQVSRNHAMIRWQGNCYTITDLNSSNGTMVNGRKIAPGKPVVLHNDDHIFLANEEFIFRMLD